MVEILFFKIFCSIPSSLWNGLIICALLAIFFAYAAFNISFGFYLRAFCSKPICEKLIALTFDDGPHQENTARVLDVLKQYDVKATFFVIGEHVADNENIVRRIHSEGHQTGNHSFSHKNSFPFFGAQKMAADMLQCEEVIGKATEYQTKWFRPPFGVTNPNVAKAVKMRGYRVAGWSIRSLDTVKSNREKVVRRVVSRLRPGAVVLLHDNLAETHSILEQIIMQAKEKGYGFVTVEQLYKSYN